MSSVVSSDPVVARRGAASIRRFVNDSIAEDAVRTGSPSGWVIEFVCECGDLRCRTPVGLTLAEYAATSRGVVAGH